ncbi:ArgS-related anticodon-binding protein NrtL [Streptomyces sp. NPDC050704]|uniref:ArgS-related anticodon-binding protein NrtL n=1 Tax=Streptomyces sp. NPDC050704 TaxID=3157219 RepID=UPI003445F1B2
MTPVELSRTVLCAVRRAVDAGELTVPVPERAVVTAPGPGGCGDYATNVALQLARPAGRPPRQVAEILRPHITGAQGVTRVEITGPGFLNITLAGGEEALVQEILRRGDRYGFIDEPLTDTEPPAETGPTTETEHARKPVQPIVQLHHPCEVRAAVTAQVVARILRSQGALVRTSCDSSRDSSCEAELDPAWAAPLGVTVDAHGDRPGAPARVDIDPVDLVAPVDLAEPVLLRPVPPTQDPTPLGRDAARWALLHPAGHDRSRITADHLVQRESNPLFRVRYAHARTRALTRNAAALGFTGAVGDVRNTHHDTHHAEDLLGALAAYPHVLAAAARHRAPDRLARHLVVVADALLAVQHTVLPLGDEKPSAAHRARLALAEAAGTVLAGGLSLLGISAPDHL